MMLRPAPTRRRIPYGSDAMIPIRRRTRKIPKAHYAAIVALHRGLRSIAPARPPLAEGRRTRAASASAPSPSTLSSADRAPRCGLKPPGDEGAAPLLRIGAGVPTSWHCSCKPFSPFCTVGEYGMRQSIVFVGVIAVLALAADTVPVAAQSPTSYPWCLRGARSGGMSCYFTSYQQCRTTLSGIGGYCMRSPYYRGPFQ
jgi:Protein of unknown function (DUF3551)